MKKIYEKVKGFLSNYIGEIVQIYFAVSLIPLLLYGKNVPLLTSVMTGAGLAILGITSYKKPSVGFLAVVNGIIWFIIALKEIV